MLKSSLWEGSARTGGPFSDWAGGYKRVYMSHVEIILFKKEGKTAIQAFGRVFFTLSGPFASKG